MDGLLGDLDEVLRMKKNLEVGKAMEVNRMSRTDLE